MSEEQQGDQYGWSGMNMRESNFREIREYGRKWFFLYIRGYFKDFDFTMTGVGSHWDILKAAVGHCVGNKLQNKEGK